jgi:hypothetical protein
MMATRGKVPADPRGGHVRLHWELVDSVAWRALSWADRGLYIAIRRKLLGSNNGNIEASLSTLRHAGVTSSASLAKGLRALMTVGFLAKTRQGGIAYGQKVCSLYRFTDELVLQFPKLNIKAMRATNEWRQFGNLAEVRAALKAAHDAAKRPAMKRAGSGLQKMKGIGSVSERKASMTDSIDEQEAAASVQKLKLADRAKTRRKAP